jgi:predicted regulator of Ras-like GTPase activity (Roadblock/LC7/MglB family)
MRISFGNRISAQSWDRALAELELTLQESSHAGNQSSARPLDFDLSAVGFADFIILGRILILVAGIASTGGAVNVIPPTSALLPQEESLLARPSSVEASGPSRQQTAVAQRRRQRIACRLFMRQAGFLSALDDGPWPKGRVKLKELSALLPDSRPAEPELAENDLEDIMPALPPLRQRRLVPYRWLAPQLRDPASETRALESEMLALGLDAEDSAVLAHIVTEELIQNVRDHAALRHGDPPAPLVGLVALQAKAYNSRVDDFDSSLHNMLSSAARLNSQLVRLFVGDAGQGIEPLGSETETRSEHDASTDIQAAIFHALETWTPSPADHLPIRGLWKLDRVIQSYSGSLILSSKGAVAGHVFDETAGTRRVSAVLPYRMPGTIAECSLPIITGRLRPLQHGELASRSVDSGMLQVLNLRPVSVVFDPKHGIDPETRQRVQRVLSELSQSDGLVIAAEVPKEKEYTGQAELEAFIRDVLNLGARAAEVAPVGIVFAGINRTSLGVSIADFNQRADTAADTAGVSLSNTFLVVAQENLHYWMAGPQAIRKVFNELSQMDAPLPVDRLTRDNRLIQQIRVQPGLRLVMTVVSLRLRPQDVVGALTGHFAEKLRQAVASAEINGVEEGTFLAPGLRFASRWINVQQLLTTLNCRSTVAFLLAVMTRNRVGIYLGSSGIFVLRVGSISRDLATVFALSLTGSAKYYDAASDIPVHTDKQHPPEPVAFVICTDLVSTAAAVKMAAREIAAYGGKAIAVASILDGREYGPDDDAEHIAVDDLQVPFVKVAVVSISIPEEPTDFEPIDPVIGEPVSSISAQARSRIDQNTYIAALKRTSAARIGHIERAGKRHYTAYVDPTLLFRDRAWETQAINLMVKRIKAARQALDLVELDGCPVVVMYPNKTRDNMGEVARMLADALSAAKVPVEGTIRVPRAAFGGRWTFPSAIALPQRPLHAVVMDPVCRSGQTTRQLIRLAAVPQVHSITSFILLNGLNEAEALALHQQASVEPVNPLTGRLVPDRTIPLGVSFLYGSCRS